MTDDRRQDDDVPQEPRDDDVVPHPFGAGSLGDRVAEPGTEAETGTDPAARTDPETEPESEPESEPEPEAATATGTATGAGSTEDADAAGAAEERDAGPEAGVEPVDGPARPRASVTTARRRRDPLAAALIGVLTLLLGFAFAVQVRSVGDDQKYEGAREEDLVRILDELNAREERLREQLSEQRSALQQLTSSDSQSAAALEEARRRAEAIGILNGTIAAQGPGLTMTIRDPEDEVRVADMLDAIQELRGAGAETMQIDGVRVGVSTAITGDPGDLMVDGRPITAPYEFVVIGSPQDMETAMNIPGGVVPQISGRGGTVDIAQADQVVVDALRPLDTPQYAEPDTD